MPKKKDGLFLGDDGKWGFRLGREVSGGFPSKNHAARAYIDRLIEHDTRAKELLRGKNYRQACVFLKIDL